MEDGVPRKKNIILLEDIQLTLKCLSQELALMKQDIHYIKTLILMKDKVKQDQEKTNNDLSIGWRIF
tara:strand:+ start:1067 stop:1267 length:201 start_codon:yes stop_codon:yes gene_type:complete